MKIYMVKPRISSMISVTSSMSIRLYVVLPLFGGVSNGWLDALRLPVSMLSMLCA